MYSIVFPNLIYWMNKWCIDDRFCYCLLFLCRAQTEYFDDNAIYGQQEVCLHPLRTVNNILAWSTVKDFLLMILFSSNLSSDTNVITRCYQFSWYTRVIIKTSWRWAGPGSDIAEVKMWTHSNSWSLKINCGNINLMLVLWSLGKTKICDAM